MKMHVILRPTIVDLSKNGMDPKKKYIKYDDNNSKRRIKKEIWMAIMRPNKIDLILNFNYENNEDDEDSDNEGYTFETPNKCCWGREHFQQKKQFLFIIELLNPKTKNK